MADVPQSVMVLIIVGFLAFGIALMATTLGGDPPAVLLLVVLVLVIASLAIVTGSGQPPPRQAPLARGPATCTGCSAHMPGGAKFCPKCGAGA